MPDDIAVGLDQSASRADEIQILEGSTFMLSDPHGDIIEHTPSGFFHKDTRHLSGYRLTVDGVQPMVLTSGTVDYFSAAFYLTNAGVDHLLGKSMSIQRYRIVNKGFQESILIRNHLQEPIRFEVRLECAVDFADLFDNR
jgi:glycogen debranching enzyme